MKETIQGWLVTNDNDEFNWCGNGGQWQAPIFRTRTEAVDFREESHGLNGEIFKVTIQIIKD